MDQDRPHNEYVFGPVPSRRLGRSLGVDLVPFKTCSYDCIYCQLGRTTCKTLERRAWVPQDLVLEQLQQRLQSDPDVITLSGSGEPTLYEPLESLIAGIKSLTDVPVVVLTNGSLLWQPEVRQALMGADRVVPSLDAGRPDLFQYVNRPAAGLEYEAMVEGLVEFRRQYQGLYWLEVMLINGVTTTQQQIEAMRDIIARIKPDRVQVNTVVRPPVESFAQRVPAETLARLARKLSPEAEVIADVEGVHQQAEFVASRDDVLTLLQRRPCSVEDIAHGLGLHRNAVIKIIQELSDQQRIESIQRQQTLYYRGVS